MDSVDGTIILAKKIFTCSTSKEYTIMKDRMERERQGMDKPKAGGGIGLINLSERRK